MEKLTGGLNYPDDELLVLNYHSTPRKFIPQFEEQIKFYKNHFDLITPHHLADHYNGTRKGNKCGLLITFDDGLKNNLYAAEVLESQNIKALFFIVPGFIDTPEQEQKKFYLKNIRPVVNEHIDQLEEDFQAMNWNELKQLCKKGHAVGCHTFNHTLSVNNTDAKNSENEIVSAKMVIEQKLDIKLSSYCSINNTLQSTGAFEKQLIRQNYTFHFTTFPGSNAHPKDPLFIKRRNVEVFWLDGSLYYALGKRDLSRWKNSINEYNAL